MIFLKVGEHLSSNDRNKLLDLLKEFHDVFVIDTSALTLSCTPKSRLEVTVLSTLQISHSNE